jgi:hypothetical protein
MAAKKRVVVIGARGVFGTLLVRELAPHYEIVEVNRGMTFDPRGAFAVACTAGPFQSLDRGMVRTSVESGAHWLDIADDERWFFDLLDDRELDALARERGVSVMPGLSTLPAVSGALVRRLGDVKRVDITLFIGNRNAKGAAAIASAAASGGRTLRSPDRELLRRELGIDAEAHVKFEIPFAAMLMRIIPPRMAAKLAKPFRFGTSGGYVEVRGGGRAEKLVSPDQRIAVLPLVFALSRIERLAAGVHAPSVLDPDALLAFCDAACASAFS